MLGTEADPGVNTRALKTLFSLIEKRSASHVYNLHMSIADIYNNEIRDLLSGSSPTGKDCAVIDVRRNPETKKMELAGIVKEPISNEEDVQKLLELATSKRKVNSNGFNEFSSRSHLIVTVYCDGADRLADKHGVTSHTSGKLHLIDLVR